MTTALVNVIVENGGYGLDNLGDVAMLQMAVSRLDLILPNAIFWVIAEEKERLLRYLPNVRLLPMEERRAWLSPFNLVGGFQHFFPGKTKVWLLDKEACFRICHPDVALKIISWRFGKDSEKYIFSSRFVDRIKNADMVVADGGGYIADSFSSYAIQLLDVLRLANRLDRPTVMVGQGVGPISHTRLLKMIQQVYPKLSLLGLRESVLSPEIARSVIKDSKTKLIVTGDDAVELAYEHRPLHLGGKLGVNIRLAGYSEIMDGTVQKVGKVINEFMKAGQLEYEIIPISLVEGASDTEAVKNMLGVSSIDEKEHNRHFSVEEVIERVGRCRVVVTGSYHAGVFALSQGIQVVALTASKYYDSKFLGLKNQFSTGLQLVHLDEGFDVVLSNALSIAWANADNERLPLLGAAEKQVSIGKQAYLQLPKFINV